ncbi:MULTISPECIES: ABC transporter ATP-binding protein [unclassified Archaeoglobus]|jgi:ABC-type sugar transport system ATPase subunit|uniref:ABC transporter ATP-binding protein n=1 Tax=unclassified Archaeoglobus TaxID=2643606 RepID=UPI0025BDFBD5|nr:MULTISPECIES: ABC transporter ATP-binding protein [unclassified Archaeoglobus]
MIKLQNVTVVLGDFLLKANLDVQNGEVVAIFGPNGCGKTTLLETIAGFYKPTHGRIIINGRDVTREPPENRNVGYVPQDLLLLPHLTVVDNIKFATRNRISESRIAELTRMFSIDKLLNRFPRTLSGGEKQRVAIVRAIARNPDILLLDEPFSSVDHSTKLELQEKFRKIYRTLNIPVIHVTHDLDEAEYLADRVIFMKDGKIIDE